MMFSLFHNCCYRLGQTLKTLNCRGIQPRSFNPMLNCNILYSNGCTPNVCGTPSSTQKYRPQKPQNPCGGGGGHHICYKPYVARGIIDHDYKNMALQRPMSPHLQIFTMTSPAAMSILQRITGVIVTGYALLLAGGALFLSNGIETYLSILQSLDMSTLTVNILKVLIGLPFSFHYFNGIRFCIWNTARGLTLKQVSFTATLAVVLSFVGAGVFAFYF